MTDNLKPEPTPKQRDPRPDRVPIRIERLMFQSDGNGSFGMRIPDGVEGKGERVVPNLFAGIAGDVKTEIEHRPWERVFRVTKWKKTTRTGTKGEIVEWVPMGKPFRVPEVWCVSVALEDL